MLFWGQIICKFAHVERKYQSHYFFSGRLRLIFCRTSGLQTDVSTGQDGYGQSQPMPQAMLKKLDK